MKRDTLSNWTLHTGGVVRDSNKYRSIETQFDLDLIKVSRDCYLNNLRIQLSICLKLKKIKLNLPNKQRH